MRPGILMRFITTNIRLSLVICLFASVAAVHAAEELPPPASQMQLSAPLLSGGLPMEVVEDIPALPPMIDLTVPPDDLWQRMRNGFGMADLHSPLVASRQSWYLNRPDMLRRKIGRAHV